MYDMRDSYVRDAVVGVNVAPDVTAKTHPRHPTHWRSPGKTVVQRSRQLWQVETDCQQQHRGFSGKRWPYHFR